MLAAAIPARAQDQGPPRQHPGSSKDFMFGRPRGSIALRGVSPYVGAGAGAVHFDFLQSGDFVDFVDSSVFTDVFRSTGWAPSAHVFGGSDVHIYRQLFLQLEGRYLWSSGKLGSDFIGFDPIDLAGFRITAGISVLF